MTNCSVPRLTSRPQWLWMWKRVALSCVLTLILLAIVVPTTVHFTHHPDVPPAPPGPTPTISVPSEIPDSSTEDNNGTETSGRFVERDEWGAWPPSEPIKKNEAASTICNY
ncbi:uncharacterized protein [Temnothorax nylanderi]|uniref:uncharacterized protein n=1 Tax=Temnothorax nylanderi TaxID=102681 RepID=UPI003A8547D7